MSEQNANNTDNKPSVMHIRYLFGWIAVGLMWAMVNLLPQKARLSLGYVFGYIIKKTMPYRILVAKINIDLCFSQLSKNERELLLTKHINALGKGFVESAMSWFLMDKKFANLTVNHIGVEHMQHAVAKGNGVILLGIHTTGLELGLPLMAQHFKAVGMYRPVKGVFFDYIIQKGRLRYFKKMIPQNDLRSLLKNLSAGEIVWYACDQDFGSRAKGVFVDFMGVSTYTLPFYAKLAEKTGASVIPATAFYDDENNQYIVKYLPEITPEQMANDDIAAKTMNKCIEELIYGYEEQYYWVHRRFKTRPNNEASFYPPKPRRNNNKH